MAKEWIEKTQPTDLQDFTTIPEYRFRSVSSSDAGVAQRWFVIESAPLAKAITKTMNAKAQAQIERVKVKITKKATQWFREPIALEAWIAQLEQTDPFVRIEYTIKEQFYYCKPGKPKVENRRIESQVDTVLLTVKDEVIAPIVTPKSRFILATNVLDRVRLPDEDV